MPVKTHFVAVRTSSKVIRLSHTIIRISLKPNWCDKSLCVASCANYDNGNSNKRPDRSWCWTTCLLLVFVIMYTLHHLWTSHTDVDIWRGWLAYPGEAMQEASLKQLENLDQTSPEARSVETNTMSEIRYQTGKVFIVIKWGGRYRS